MIPFARCGDVTITDGLDEIERFALHRMFPRWPDIGTYSWEIQPGVGDLRGERVMPCAPYTATDIDGRGLERFVRISRMVTFYRTGSLVTGEVPWRTLYDEPPEDVRVVEVCDAILARLGAP